MSMIGKMQTSITISSYTVTKDTDGFGTKSLTTVATVRAYKEDKNGTETWINNAKFANVSTIFTIRPIGSQILTSNIIVCDGVQYEILNVIDCKLWLQILCKKVTPSG